MGESSKRPPLRSKRAVGQRVRRAGEALGLATRTERAERCGMALETLRDIEVGKKGPGMGVLQKICNGYRVDANWLLGVMR